MYLTLFHCASYADCIIMCIIEMSNVSQDLNRDLNRDSAIYQLLFCAYFLEYPFKIITQIKSKYRTFCAMLCIHWSSVDHTMFFSCYCRMTNRLVNTIYLFCLNESLKKKKKKKIVLFFWSNLVLSDRLPSTADGRIDFGVWPFTIHRRWPDWRWCLTVYHPPQMAGLTLVSDRLPSTADGRIDFGVWPFTIHCRWPDWLWCLTVYHPLQMAGLTLVSDRLPSTADGRIDFGVWPFTIHCRWPDWLWCLTVYHPLQMAGLTLVSDRLPSTADGRIDFGVWPFTIHRRWPDWLCDVPGHHARALWTGEVSAGDHVRLPVTWPQREHPRSRAVPHPHAVWGEAERGWRYGADAVNSGKISIPHP